ncbi:helix-turn-helix domain-containing protein [Empedobacter brevis]|nr:helix-turn-helix domain-containing protein [Empedobacter brevis]
MEYAKALLTEQHLTISEIAYLIGYKNQRHFSSAFKKKFGISPSQLYK